MRLFLGFALLSVASVFTACTVGDDGPSGSSSGREVCGNDNHDDDGDGYFDDREPRDQDCFAPADAGPGPAADSGPGTPPPPAPSLVDVRIAWQSGMGLRFSQIQGCYRDGGACIVERFNLGSEADCSADLGTVVCRLSGVRSGTRIDFNSYGEWVDGAGTVWPIWGVGLDAAGAVATRGTIFVSEDRNRDSSYDVDRTSAVTVVLNPEGDGRNWSIVVGR